MSFSFNLGMGPRGAINRFGKEGEEGHFFNKHIVLGMLAFVRPYRRNMLIASGLLLAVTGLTLLIPYLIKIAIDEFIVQGDNSGLSRIAIGIFAAYLLLYLTTMAQQYLLGWTSKRVLADVRQRMMSHLQTLSLGYYDRTIVGVTVSRVINDVSVINDLLTQGVITLIGDMLVLVGIVVVMLLMSPRLALLTFVTLPLMTLATYLFSVNAKGAFRLTRKRVAELVGNLAENINSIRVIQTFAQEGFVEAQFEEINRNNREAHIEAVRLSFVFLPSIEFLGVLATGIVLYFGGRAVVGEEVTVGILVAFMAYVTRFFQPVQELSRIYTTMQSAMAGGEQVLKLLNTPSDVTDPAGAREMPPIDGAIQLENVTFRYLPDSAPVLQNVTLAIASGQTVALVGPTGAGKTTIANLIPRFYEVSEGGLFIDGLDIRTVTQTSLRQQFGIVPQDPFLFAGSIADNIRFGRPGTPLADVVEAAKLANAHDFITRLPDGYETKILEGAVNLSVGQRQLVCIARATLVNPRILILDEATANIDTVTEVLIQEALENLMTGRTAVVIAHRLSTIRNADLICVVDNGQIVQQGTHQELVQMGGLYQQLYDKAK